jgi:hypothetical protein
LARIGVHAAPEDLQRGQWCQRQVSALVLLRHGLQDRGRPLIGMTARIAA